MMTPQSLRFDHYELDAKLGEVPRALSEDSTGATYRARDLNTRQPVLIRMMGAQLLQDEAVQRRFVENARALIEEEHPQITRIIDIGNDGTAFFYALESAGGMTVEELVSAQGPLDPSWTLERFRELVGALMVFQGRLGMVVRVWPRTLIISGAGTGARMHLVAQNLIPGTDAEQPEYRAPEVLDQAGETVPATLYSMGATLYHVLSGRSPYPSGLPLEGLRDLKRSQAPDWNRLPGPAVAALIERAMAVDPAERPGSFREWERLLEQAIGAGSAGAAPGHVEKAAAPPVPDGAAAFQATASPAQSGGLVGEEESGLFNRRFRELSDELEQAKQHTQRLSMELTKRVQKELVLKERVEQLESELREERDRIRELSAAESIDAQTMEAKELAAEKARLERAWSEVNEARSKLERQRSEYLKDTQRFSITQLIKEQAGAIPPKSESVVARKSAPKPPPPKLEPLKPKTPEQPKPGERAAESKPEPKPEHRPKDGEPRAQRPLVSPFKVAEVAPVPKRVDSEGQAAASIPAPLVEAEKPIEEDDWLLGEKAPERVGPVERDPSPARPPVKVAESKPRSEAQPEPEVFLKPEVPETVFRPVPGAWVALAVLGGAIGFGLFLVYRTFFRMQQNYLLGSVGPSQPTVIEVQDPGEAADDPQETEEFAVDPGDRESMVNEELRVDMLALQNFVLLRNGEWGKLLESLKAEEADKELSAEERQRIREELWNDVRRRLEMNQDENLLGQPAFRDLYEYLETSMKAGAEGRSSGS